MANIKKKFVVRVSTDFSCLFIVALPILILNVVGVPFRRGFFCDDESLMHPYKSNTIPTWLAAVVALTIPTFLLCTDVAKYSIGRLRPHFLTLCKPSVNCTTNPGNLYIEQDVCTATDKAALREARLSFPSGHASLMMYSMLFVVIYLQKRMRWRKCWLLRPFIQLFMFFLAYYTCMSRISDYMHHWSDVLGGSILGITISFLIIYFTTDIMSDVVCCQSVGVGTCDTELPLYKPAPCDEKDSSNSTISNNGNNSPRAID